MIGMGAVTGAVLGAPISTILIIFELTGGYALTIAVMIATVIASTITQQVHGSAFFHRVLEKRGFSPGEGQEMSVFRETRVRSLLDPAVHTIDAGPRSRPCARASSRRPGASSSWSRRTGSWPA